MMFYRAYKWGGQQYYRPVMESMLFGRFIMTIGERYRFVKSKKVKLLLVKEEEFNKPNFLDRFSYMGDRLSEWSKEYSYSKFLKRFKFNDKKAFAEKLETLRKALVLT